MCRSYGYGCKKQLKCWDWGSVKSNVLFTKEVAIVGGLVSF
ncbi:hypothetical protein JCM19235_4388 [Vibrio maritimus]|uniref:Uncharacterized protein n=1 Tax=Vibrio maritimus TaxID=990268 RepID=A0A090S059_9VIBR|nr:hypothetical protein JCM19235_4388 [Vibrio maritimus]